MKIVMPVIVDYCRASRKRQAIAAFLTNPTPPTDAGTRKGIRADLSSGDDAHRGRGQ